MAIIINFDRAIAKNRHRVKMKKLQMDWDFFNDPENIMKDVLFSESCKIVFNYLVKNKDVIIFTERSKSIRELTMQWMKNNCLEIGTGIYCDEVKDANMLWKVIEEVSNEKEIIALDDVELNNVAYNFFHIQVFNPNEFFDHMHKNIAFQNI